MTLTQRGGSHVERMDMTAVNGREAMQTEPNAAFHTSQHKIQNTGTDTHMLI